MKPTREQRRQLARDNLRYPVALIRIGEEEWPEPRPRRLIEVWRSREFLVQVFSETDDIHRLSVCRTEHGGDSWIANISWDELQRLKRECGRGDLDAVEVFPADRDMVNVANMRHLWVLPDRVPFAWRASK